MPGLSEWLVDFRQLHEQARRGELDAPELARYRARRDELARALLAVQRLQLKAGEVPRRALRVARALQVDLDLGDWQTRAVTLDVSTGGFSCLLARAPRLAEDVRYTLRLPGTQPLAGMARVQDVKVQQGNVRASFELLGSSEAEKERLEMLVFDTALSQLTPA
jgi:hypothetical protein